MSERPPAFHPHLSADGAWRWDGQAWVRAGTADPSAETRAVPVHAAGAAQHAPIRPPQDPPPAAHASAAADVSAAAQAEPTRGAEHGGAEGSDGSEGSKRGEAGETSSRYGWGMVGVLIGASLVVLAAIIGGALLAYRAAGSPPPNPVVTPSARPVDPNSLKYLYLAGVTVPSVTTSLKGDGFSCAAPAPPENNLRNWRCDRTRGTQHDIVQIWAVDEMHVHLIDVTTVAQSGALDEQGVLAVRNSVVQLVYPASSPQQAQATAWVGSNGSGSATTSVGGVRLRTDQTDVATLLEFDAGTRS